MDSPPTCRNGCNASSLSDIHLAAFQDFCCFYGIDLYFRYSCSGLLLLFFFFFNFINKRHFLLLIPLNIKGLKVCYGDLQVPLQVFGTSLQASKAWKSTHAELDVHIWRFPDLPSSVFSQSLTQYLNLKMCYWFKVPYSGCQLHSKILGSFPARFSESGLNN